MPEAQEYYIHPRAVVETDQVGNGTRIWANAHVMKDVVIGERCNVGEGCFIESGVRIGNDVVIKNNIAIWVGVTIEDGAFLGPNVVFTNELEPRSGYPKEVAPTLVKRGASIGANATIIANRIIGEFATVGAGSVVTRDVPPHRLVYGNPARVRGWMCVCGRKLDDAASTAHCACGRRYTLSENALKALS